MPTHKPQTPPPLHSLLQEVGKDTDLLTRLGLGYKRADLEPYLHWDQLRRRTPPNGLTHRQWWLVEKLRRRQTPLPLTGTDGRPFSFCQPPLLLKGLHEIDMQAGASVIAPEALTDAHNQERYRIRTLMEEAITSSQMEGAATTRDVAKEMIRAKRPPRDRSEQMILNNYRTMQRIRELQDEALTPELVLELHRIITEEALDDPDGAGRLRPPGTKAVVSDIYGTVFHQPPAAEQLPERLEQLCAFANGITPELFLHPVVRAIGLHFWLAYDHPFIDGNGRTARALFYWSMLHQGYWLFAFISISSVINRARGKYELAFLHTETDDNDLTYFLLAQVNVIQQAIKSLRDYLERKASAVTALHCKLGRVEGLNHRQLALLHHALRHPGFIYTVTSHQTSHGVSNQTARTDLQTLADRALLNAGRQGRRAVFRVPEDLPRRLNQRLTG